MKFFRYLFSLPKTVFFNFHYFGFRGLFPIRCWIAWNTKLNKLGKKGSLILHQDSQLKFGMSEGTVLPNSRPLFCQYGGSILDVSGVVSFSAGVQLVVGKGAKLCFSGGGCFFNSNALILCSGTTIFGGDVHVGWNCTFMDSDGHSLDCHVTNGKILIGSHVWIANGATLLKETELEDGCVVGARALLTHSSFKAGSLVVSPKAAAIKECIKWKM
jgi:acetyltransferase-like isoleucine patch superfamily enzyme